MGYGQNTNTCHPNIFNDETGDKLFQQIMACPEYYPTGVKWRSCRINRGKWLVFFYGGQYRFRPGGAGTRRRDKVLVPAAAVQKDRAAFTYYPIDISSNVIGWLENTLPETLPGIRMQGLNGEYLEKLQQVNTFFQQKKIVLFMGAKHR